MPNLPDRIAPILALILLSLLNGCATSKPAGTTERLVEIGGGRRLWMACAGSGSPTIVIVPGANTGGDSWSFVVDDAGAILPSATSVLPEVARTNRVCTYDRPQVTRVDGTATTSTPVTQPTTAADDVADLRALLLAAGESGPYVLVGHSWAGLIIRLFAGAYPGDVMGLVFVDASSVYLAETLSPQEWLDFQALATPLVALGMEAPGYGESVRQVRATSVAPGLPAIVLTADQPFDLGIGDVDAVWTAWIEAQARLAAELGAEHVLRTGSGHLVYMRRPALVVDAIRSVLRRSETAGLP